MKKNLLKLALVIGMAAALSGCAKPASDTAASGKTGESTTAKTEVSTTAKDTEAEGESQSSLAADDKGTFTVGFDQDFPPMGFKAEDGTYTGFDLELAAEVAKRLGKEFVPQPIVWDTKDLELGSGSIDCVWNGFTMTGREDKYTWTKPYMNNSQVFVVSKGSNIASRADLAGKIVEVQTDSSAEAALKEDPELTATFGKLQTTPDYNTAFMDLEMGAVDAVAMDIIVAEYQISKRGVDFIVLDDTLASEEYGIGFKLGNEALRDQVQTTLEEMAADGTLKTISEKWFNRDLTIVGK